MVQFSRIQQTINYMMFICLLPILTIFFRETGCSVELRYFNNFLNYKLLV